MNGSGETERKDPFSSYYPICSNPWAPGDPNNVLQFLSKGKVVQTITTSDVVNFINQSPDKNGYMGNPNPQFKGQDSSEPFAFLNFFAKEGVTFDEVLLSNNGSTGFESDNHTVATTFRIH